MSVNSEIVEICNNALIESGSDKTITNLDESSPEALRCRRVYDSTRRELLSMYPWGFARKIVHLARFNTDDDPVGYEHAYMYPSDALRINNFYVSEEGYVGRKIIPFEKADFVVAVTDGVKTILCDYKEPVVEMVLNVETPSLFPADFTRLLYLYMALKIAKMSGSKKEILNQIMTEISAQTSIVATNTNREGVEPKNEINYYIDSRG